MSDPSLASGDKVVDLAALLRASAMLTGAVATAVSLWVLNQSALWAVVGVVLGGTSGFFLGAVIGPMLFPARAGDVMVVKLGPGALPLALKAGLIGGVLSGILAGLLPPIMMSQVSRVAHLVGIDVGVGALVGAAAAYIATRP